MTNFKIKFSPMFLLMGVALIVLGQGYLFASCIFALLAHEFAHAFVAKCFGYQLSHITLMPYGAKVSGDLSGLQPKEEVMIALAGPAVSLVLAAVIIAGWYAFPSFEILKNITKPFVINNISLGIVNLLPVFPMDGGRILNGLIGSKLAQKTSEKVVGVVGLTVGAITVVLSCVGVLFWGFSFSAVIMSVFMVASAIGSMNGINYTTLLANHCRGRAFAKGLKVRHIALTKDAKVVSLIRLADGRHYDVIHILDENLGVVKTFDEFEVLKIIAKYPSDAKLSECIE